MVHGEVEAVCDPLGNAAGQTQFQVVSANDLGAPAWRKSSWSAHNGNCVEVAALPGGEFGVRDSKEKGSSVLVFNRSEWSLFLAQCKEWNL
jgi:hypothetical protein